MHFRAIVLAALFTAHPVIASADATSPTIHIGGATNSSLFLSGVSVAGSSAGKQCPNEGRMSRLCHYIYSKTRDPEPHSDYAYGYQRIVYEASCVDFANDSDETIAEKVRDMWARHGQHLRCGPMGVPATGSPIRYAIHTDFHDFISDAVGMWRLDLNGLENGQTMLDFVDERIAKSSGALKSNLEGYRRSFIRLGAKKAEEL
jgi:hypothetical protein